MINCCVYGVPPPPYIKEQGGRCGRLGGGAPGGVLLLPGVGLPSLSLVGLGLGGKEEREERKGGAPLLVQFGLGGEGRAAAPWPPLYFLH